jgi:hypothetical protein
MLERLESAGASLRVMSINGISSEIGKQNISIFSNRRDYEGG